MDQEWQIGNVFELWTKNCKLETFVKLFEIQDKKFMTSRQKPNNNIQPKFAYN